ncbi:uncharacterized protein MONOS_16490 [Monocercomonoides exilis]|uniref:uncharacterized protein n=1 Tax=Monocercomonoides exilis TaxID=2049356 RepID=UPI003559492E|nr:hypothetical protein MONOS_16490 [Monocercomonoides exilis]
MKTVRSYIDSYAYRDTMVNPPAPYKRYDILAELSKIENTEYANGLEYHQAIATAFNNLEDAHTNYVFPCSSLFAYIFPFRFVFEVPDASKPSEIVVKVTESTFSNLTQYFIESGGTNITGKQVLKLDLPDLDGSGNMKPEEAIAKWADKYVKTARTPAARLAYALTYTDFEIRTPYSMPIPNDAVKITVKNADGEQTVNVPFYGAAVMDIKDVNDMLNTKCPLQDKVQNNLTSNSNSFEQQSFEEDEKHYQAVMEAHKDNPLFQQIYESIWKSPELKNLFIRKPDSIPIPKKLTHPIEEEISSRVKDIISQQFALSDEHQKNGNQKQSFKARIEEKLRKMKKNGEFEDFDSAGEGEPKLTILKKDKNVLAAVVDAYKLGYLSIGTFAPSSDEEIASFMEVIITSVVETRAKGYKLIIDLRGNGGGYIILSDWLFMLLFPEEYPIFPTRSVVASELSKIYISEVSQPPFEFVTEPVSQDLIKDVWAKPKTKVTVIGDDGKERSQEWVYKHVEDSERAVNSLLSAVPLAYRNARLYAPSEILVLSDGTCGSACAQFLKRMKEKKLGKVAGLGSEKLSESGIPFDIASFASGNVIDTSYVEQVRPKAASMRENRMLNNMSNDEPLPSYPRKVQRGMTNIRISLTTSFSFDWNTLNEQPEFKIIEPDEIYPIFADKITGFTPSGILDTITKVKSSFDKCYDWEVKDNYACPIPANNKNAVYGNPCSNKKFDKNQCKLSRCERGYYLNRDNICQKRPSMGRPKYQEDPSVCMFDPMTPMRADVMIDCLKQLPYDKTEAANTLKTIRDTLAIYAYRDTIANPPAPFENDKVDILGELDKIEKEDYSSGLEFHNAIGTAFAKLKDAHTIYNYPCSQPFVFALPYTFKFEVPDPSKPNEITVKLTEYISLLSNFYAKEMGRSFKDRVVTKITMTDLNEVANEKPEVTIARWCDENVPLSRTPAARLNYGLDQMFAVRSPTYNKIVDGSVNVTLKTADGGTETIPLYWYGLSTAEISGSTLLYDDYCKLDKHSANNENEHQTTKEESSLLNNRMLQSSRKADAKLIEEYESFTKMSKEQLAKQNEIKIKEIREKYANDTKFVKAYEKFMGNKPLREMLMKDRILHKSLDQLLPPAIQTIRKIMNDENQKKAEESKARLSRMTNAVRVKEIGTLPGIIHGVTIPEWKLGYCHIMSFSPSSDEDMVKFLKVFADVVSEVKNNNYKMVIDVRNNGGGIIYLGAQLYHFLFPETFPINPRYNFVRGNASDYIASIMADKKLVVYTDYETLDVVDDVLALPTTTKKTIVGGKERSQTWSGSYSLNSDRYLYEFVGSTIPSSLYGKNLFDPNDLMFITDGECGSTCSQFLKHVKEAQMAKVIGIGGQLTRKEIDYDIASFAAGNVIRSSSIEELKKEVSSSAGWPSKFPRQNTDLSFAMLTGYSFDWKTEDQQLEFKIVKPDVVYPYYPNIEEARDEKGYLTLLEKVKKYFDVCYDWQVKVNTSCTVPSEDANAVYGNPCKQGKFTSECAFARCANGYYRNRNEKCVKYPVMPPLPKEEDKPKKLSSGAIAGIVIGCVLAVLVVIAVIAICVVKGKKSKKAKKDDYLNVKLTEQSYPADGGVPIKL